MRSPNILFLAIDDMRPELGCYGSPVAKSPNIDQLASEGMRFDRNYCQVPVCGASRACLMTGVLPTKNRFIRAGTRVDEDAPNASLLPETFKKAGYTTLSFGKVLHHQTDSDARCWSRPAWRPDITHSESYDPATTEKLSEHGRGRFYEHPDVPDNSYYDGQVALRGINELSSLKQEGSPFFLSLGFITPHLPFYTPKKYWDLYDESSVGIADNLFRPSDAPEQLNGGSNEVRQYHQENYQVDSEDWHRKLRHGYLAGISYTDKLIGDVLLELRRLDLEESTIVVLWVDHGWHLGEHTFWGKHNTMTHSTRTPLIIKVPGKASGHTTSITETADLFPTLCQLAGLETPEKVQGKSFLRLLEDPSQPFRDFAYSRFRKGDAVFSHDFSYTSFSDGEAEMLYDLQLDPDENHNVAHDGSYQSKLSSLRDQLQERIRQAEAFHPPKEDVHHSPS